WLAKIPALEDTTRLSREVARRLTEWQALTDPAEAMAVKKNLLPRTVDAVKEFVGIERETFADEVLRSVRSERRRLWRAEVQKINWELFDRGVQAFTWLAMEELAKSAHANGLLNGAPRSKELARFAEEATRAQVGREPDE